MKQCLVHHCFLPLYLSVLLLFLLAVLPLSYLNHIFIVHAPSSVVTTTSFLMELSLSFHSKLQRIFLGFFCPYYTLQFLSTICILILPHFLIKKKSLCHSSVFPYFPLFFILKAYELFFENPNLVLF